MTFPTRSPRSSTTSDMDVNSLMNNREFQEILQEYFQSNTMTLDEFLENLPRFMMENYGTQERDDEDEDYFDDTEEEMEEEEENIAIYMRRAGGNFRAVPNDYADNLLHSLLTGRRAAAASQEIPLRTILPQSPPPSPVPNLATRMGPPLPARPLHGLRRVPSQLRRAANTPVRVQFDPNAPEEVKSPYNQLSEIASPPDRNNAIEMPMTREFMRRYGFENQQSIDPRRNNPSALFDEPER